MAKKRKKCPKCGEMMQKRAQFVGEPRPWFCPPVKCRERQNAKLTKAIRYALKTLGEEFATYSLVKENAIKTIKAIMKEQSNG